MEPLLSFKNNPKIKSDLIARMDKHIMLDELMQGEIGENGRGCTVWCALNNGKLKEGYNHESFVSILGLPEWLARLQDTIFEGLDVEDAKSFSSAWPKAIPVGKNLDPVKWKFCVFVLKENIERVLSLDIADDLKKEVVTAIQQVVEVHESAIESGEWNEAAAATARSVAEAARSAAEAARSVAEASLAASVNWGIWSAESAAWSAAWSAAEAARSAAMSATEARWSAVWSAAEAARSAAEAKWSASAETAYKRYADELLRLLELA